MNVGSGRGRTCWSALDVVAPARERLTERLGDQGEPARAVDHLRGAGLEEEEVQLASCVMSSLITDYAELIGESK